MEAFLDGSLEAWLKGCYYEEESQKMQGLEKEDTRYSSHPTSVSIASRWKCFVTRIPLIRL